MSWKTLSAPTGARRMSGRRAGLVCWLAVVSILVSTVLSCNGRTGSGGSQTPSCNADECKVVSSDGVFGTSFSAVVAASGDFMAVGAPDDSEAAFSAGAVYIYERDGVDWNFVQKIVADDATERDRFGAAIDLEGDALIVGARHADASGEASGAAYVFRRNGDTWDQEEKIIPTDGDIDDGFGASVAINGTTAVVGAPLDDDATFAAGAVYVFSFDGTTWLPEDQKITSSNVGPGDLFGFSVATDGTSIAVGAPFKAFDPPEFDPSPDPNDTPANNFAQVGIQRNAGNGYIYRWDGASFTDEVIVFGRRDPRQCEIIDLQLLLSGETSVPYVFEGFLFGQVTDVDGDLVVFGAPYGDGRINQGSGCRDRRGTQDIGVAYVYRWDGADWAFEERLIDNDSTANSLLGFSVGVVDAAEERVIVGAPGDRENGVNAGSAFAYVYDAMDDEWNRRRIEPSDGAEFSRFGSAAAIQDDTNFFGAVSDRNAGAASGAVYVFED